MKCTFCGIDTPPGKGKTFVRTTGKVLYFCSNKCEKNMLKLQRIPRKVRWTEEFRKERRKRSAKK